MFPYDALPTIESTVSYQCPFYELSGHQSRGNARRYDSQYAMEDAQVHLTNVCDHAYFAVFDGHGGAAASQWCANHLHEYLQERIGADVQETLRQTFLDVDETLKTLPFHEDGTTAAILLFDGSNRMLYCANVGDSSVVLCRNGQAIELSKLHKLSNPDERNRIDALTPEDMRRQVFQGSRVLGFSLTRALGDHIHFTTDFSVKDYIIGTPHTSRTNLVEEDEFCILASDGVWDSVSPQEAVEHVRKALESGDSLVDASRRLVQLALENRTIKSGLMVFDDISVLVLRFFV